LFGFSAYWSFSQAGGVQTFGATCSQTAGLHTSGFTFSQAGGVHAFGSAFSQAAGLHASGFTFSQGVHAFTQGGGVIGSTFTHGSHTFTHGATHAFSHGSTGVHGSQGEQCFTLPPNNRASNGDAATAYEPATITSEAINAGNINFRDIL
jgi:hypothetical protein